MKWKLATKRALEMVAWSSAPVADLGAHHAVRLKFAFLQQHGFAIAYGKDHTLWAENLWKLMEQRYGLLCMAAVLLPALGCFIQHLGLRRWRRMLIGIALCVPVLWYAGAALYLFGKVITQAP